MERSDVAALRAESRRLRRDEGRTLVKLLTSPQIRIALGQPPEAELRDRFDAAILALGADAKSLALKNAYAIGQRDARNLTRRREDFGAQSAIARGPETINNWENEKIDELIAALVTGSARQHPAELLIAVAVSGGRITVVAEGEAQSGSASRQLFNPNSQPFLPGFIYQLPPYARPGRLTILGLFFDARPAQLFAEASSDLLAFVCGDGRQELVVAVGGIPGVDAAGHAVVHYQEPQPGVYYGLHWRDGIIQNTVGTES